MKIPSHTATRVYECVDEWENVIIRPWENERNKCRATSVVAAATLCMDVMNDNRASRLQNAGRLKYPIHDRCVWPQLKKRTRYSQCFPKVSSKMSQWALAGVRVGVHNTLYKLLWAHSSNLSFLQHHETESSCTVSSMGNTHRQTRTPKTGRVGKRRVGTGCEGRTFKEMNPVPSSSKSWNACGTPGTG